MDQLTAHLDRGWDLAQQGDVRGAEASARQALEIDPSHARGDRAVHLAVEAIEVAFLPGIQVDADRHAVAPPRDDGVDVEQAAEGRAGQPRGHEQAGRVRPADRAPIARADRL